MKIQEIIANNEGTIIDVRTPEEFMGGNVVGSINIPLQLIDKQIDEIKKMAMPIILCCASGGRSGMATQYLTKNGIECANGGSWLDVNYYKSKN
jgi:rhodanese-related sulfurtransferase